jgi:hypothetical protein
VLTPIGASRRSAEVTSFLTWKGMPASSIFKADDIAGAARALAVLVGR